MPQGVSAVSMVAKCKGSLIALDKQHLSFTMLCWWIDVILPNNIRVWWALTGMDGGLHSGSNSEQPADFLICYHHLMWIHFFFLTFISSVWRRVLLLETQCFRFLPFSRKAGSVNPILYNAIPFKSSNSLDTQQKELFHLYSKTDNQHQNLRGRGLSHSLQVPIVGKSLPDSFVDDHSS